MAADIDGLPGGQKLRSLLAHGQKVVLRRGEANLEAVLQPVDVMGPHGQEIPQGEGVSQVHQGVDVGQAVALAETS